MGSGTQGPASLVGRVVNGYRLERVLGKGATGIVFLGRRADEASAFVEHTQVAALELPIEAAIKVLVLPWQLEDAERDEFRRRFAREAETLRILKHPHILAIITYGEEEAIDASYMILPYLPGGSLQDRLDDRARPFTLGEASDLLSQIADAVDFAHHPGIANIQGIVHRDIKPGNILLDARGQAFLSDFSIAKIMGQTTTRLTHTGMVPGTPMYMAPEARAGQLDATPAMDIYSLGMVAYEMVVGLRDQLSASALPAPRTLRPDLPAPVEAAIMQALSPDPAQRFPSAAAFAEAFAQGLEGRWTPGLTRFVATNPSGGARSSFEQTVPDDPTTHSVGERRTHRRWGVAGAAVALLLVVACVAALALPGARGALFAQMALGATATATGVSGGSSATQSTASGATHAPGAKPTATSKKSGGVVIVGGGGGNGGGGATTGPTAVPTARPTPGPPVAIYGDGSDGAITISSNTTFYPLDATCTGTAGMRSLVFANASSPFALLAGKPILVLQTQGSGAGNWMRNTVVSSSGTTSGTLTLRSPLNATYSAGAQVIVLRQYTSVYINAGATWSAKPWNGMTGGILAFLANGTLTNEGRVTATGLGFRGGPAGSGNNQQYSAQGEGTSGFGTNSASPNANGGGGGLQALQGGNGGGGGGNGQQGANGGIQSANVGPGEGGLLSSNTTLSRMTLGGGGGAGGRAVSNDGAGGGSGGAIIWFCVYSIVNSGIIASDGTSGNTTAGNEGAGGGGAGGSIFIQVQSGSTGIVTAHGATSITPGGSGLPGGTGGEGQIVIA